MPLPLGPTQPQREATAPPRADPPLVRGPYGVPVPFTPLAMPPPLLEHTRNRPLSIRVIRYPAREPVRPPIPVRPPTCVYCLDENSKTEANSTPASRVQDAATGVFAILTQEVTTPPAPPNMPFSFWTITPERLPP